MKRASFDPVLLGPPTCQVARPIGMRYRGEPICNIQSLSDLGNSFEIIRSMSVVPFTRSTVLQLAVITLLPVAPLLLTMVSLEELVKRLLQVVFWS